ncbi:MAG: ABC transporter ATP-binding protein [Candidatus Eisenbacteria bacterium]|uniref:ABC transporter ATP-binding protein n=1 Tax=Eiseniibacteriota bacterium TaxID=2212470 RepID=A0A849SY56_UNCEI|nr:ABC transporter ATP-binding protein [Candidatus Eisenbacteria bacterium]
MSSISESHANKDLEGRDLVLSVHGVSRSYSAPAGNLLVLDAVDLEVPRGTILAILGVSGVGKSTLLNILGTLDRPDRGTVAIRGERVEHLSESALAAVRAKRLGFVFQFHHLLPEFTAEENVMMPLLIAGVEPGVARARAREALESVGLPARWSHLPSQLSGGEAQRVAVARALAPEPDLVLADEPSGDLDPVSAEALHDLLVRLARERQRTFVIATHDERLARRADRTVKLVDGRLSPWNSEV